MFAKFLLSRKYGVSKIKKYFEGICLSHNIEYIWSTCEYG